MTWNDIKSLCLDLLCLDQLTADEEMEYSLKFQRLANQGLSSIANGVKPKIAEYDCYVYDNTKVLTDITDLELAKDIRNNTVLRNSTILGIYKLTDGYLIHCIINDIGKLYKYSANVFTPITDINNLCPVVRCKMFEQQNVVYILTDSGYLKITNNTLSEAEEGTVIDDIYVLDLYFVDYNENVRYKINNSYYAFINGEIYCDNKEQTVYPIANLHVINEPIYMPEDFLSFGNMVGSRSVNEKDVYTGRVTEVLERFVPAHYVGRTGFYVDQIGKYVIYYNALWEEITDDYTKQTEYDENNKPIAGANAELPQDKSVLAILPQYIAFNVIAQDDVQRAVVLKNDYELLLARLDTTTQYDTEDYKSSKGWY